MGGAPHRRIAARPGTVAGMACELTPAPFLRQPDFWVAGIAMGPQRAAATRRI